jgi:hypothetical protein
MNNLKMWMQLAKMSNGPRVRRANLVLHVSKVLIVKMAIIICKQQMSSPCIIEIQANSACEGEFIFLNGNF